MRESWYNPTMSNEKERPLAFGRHKVVFPEGKEHVRLEFQENYSKEEILSMFYLADLAHRLFPKHIPEPGVALPEREQGRPYLTMERIPHDREHEFLQQWYQTRLYRQRNVRVDQIEAEIRNDEGFQRVRESLEEAGFFTRLHGYEVLPRHVIRHPNGDQVFIDFEPAFRAPKDGEPTLYCNPAKLAAEIRGRKGVERESAIATYRRLRKTIPYSLRKQFPVL